MNRRLPVFFVLDVSESMAGDELYQMEAAVREILNGLRKDPHCLETISVSFIVFAGKARVLNQLEEIVSVQAPELPIGGGTALGAALELLMEQIDRQVRRGTGDEKGDWKPLIFLISDGHPTDQPTAAIQKWRSNYGQKTSLIAISMGGMADNQLLREFADHVIVFYDSAPDAYQEFVRWVSQSIELHSKSVAGSDQSMALAPFQNAAFGIAPASGGATIDNRYVVIIGRCEKSKHPYLVKYQRDPATIASLQLPEELRLAEYLMVSAMPLRESYFDLTATGNLAEIDLRKLLGQPACPHCSADFSLAVDAECGNVHCVGGEGAHVCPWCEAVGYYSLADSETDELLARRGQG